MPVQVSRQPQTQLHHSNHSNTSLTNPNTSSGYSLHRDSPTSSRDDASSTSSLSIGKIHQQRRGRSSPKGVKASPNLNGLANFLPRSHATDGRQRKRLHKNPEPASLPRKPRMREPPRSPAKSAIRSASLREPKKPLVTRGSDYSASKTDSLGRHLPPSSSTTLTNSYTPAHDPSTQVGDQEAQKMVTTFYAFGNKHKEVSTDPFEFQPSMNLEDVHRSIIDNDQLNAFPSPRRKTSGSSLLSTRGTSSVVTQNRNSQNAPTGPRAQAGSMLRKPSLTKYGQSQARESPQRRRQSGITNLPTTTTSSTTYRKNNATIEPESSIRSVKRRPSVTTGSLNPPAAQRYYKTGGYSEYTPEVEGKIPVSARIAKTKSLQPPPRQTHTLTHKPSLSPDRYRASLSYPPKSPKSPSTNKKLGSNLSSRRISIIPHASGLAARTISPTDARRLKRLSMLNTPPPPGLPVSATPAARSASGSPSMIPRKSVTPSSHSATPEPPRKGYGSGISISSNAPSARSSASSMQPKLSLNLAVSRLPRPPQLDREEEDIPPVPPLPKNLASPSEPHSGESSLAPSYDSTPYGTFRSTNNSIFGPRKSSLATDQTIELVGTPKSLDSDDSSSTGRAKSSASTLFMTLRKQAGPPEALLDLEEASTELFAEPEIFSLEAEPLDPQVEFKKPHRPVKTEAEKANRRKRGMTVGSGVGVPGGGLGFPTLESKTSSSSLRKNDLAPLRLPPLNFPPLSTPTVARVNALAPATESGDKTMTPPPKLGSRTPTTPMTASKASFFARREEGARSNHERSRSSFNHSIVTGDSPSSLSLRAGSSASSSIPLSQSTSTSRLGRQTSSPYVAAAPRPKSSSRKSQESLGGAVLTEDNTDAASPAASVHRKLSLGWKKNALGKSSHAANERAEEYSYGPGPKHDNMPPPRVPPGNVPASPSKDPYAASPARRKSSLSFLGHDRHRSDGSAKEKKPEDKPTPSTKSSILSPMKTMLGNKSSLSHLRGGRSQLSQSTDPTLDHDDLVAEEEMRKLASKRKNLDQAATQLDELKKRATPKERLSPQQVLRMGVLNIFERGEIVDFKEVYFTGLPDARKHVGDLKNSSAPNFGYDDDRGDYTIIKGDHLAYRYEIVDILGKGSFGQVVRCIDHRTGGLVAVKIIRNKKRFHQQALVEVNILQKLKEWDPQHKHSLINFTQSFYFRGHLCISTELLGMNLYEFIKSNDFRGFSLKLIRRFTKQMLSSLILLKGHRVIHCDLKPENILLAHPAHTEIKMIDFGSSCFENEKVYTYIQSRFYRSPEVILGMSYGLAIDMWSLGCILAELYTGCPIFPGENEQEQLACIMEVFGPPEKHLIEKSTRRKLFFDSTGKPRMIVSSKGRRRRVASKSLQYVLKCEDEPFVDFVARCLRWDPEKRMKPDEAMNHEFITGKKPVSRVRSANYAAPTASSDTRRYTAYSRPLPDPPGSAVKKPSASPMKQGSPMKPSTTTAAPSFRKHATGTKRNSIGAPITSTIPRVAAVNTAQRSVSGKYPSTTQATPTSQGRNSASRATAGTRGSIRLVKDEDAGQSGSEGPGPARRR